MQNKTRIFIVDDHEMFRTGLCSTLEQTGNYQIVGSVGTVDQTFKTVRLDDIDIAILDISIGRDSGLDLARALRKDRQDLPIVFVSMYPEDDLAQRLASMQRTGYVNKARPIESLIEALEVVAAGGRYINEQMPARNKDDVHPTHISLSGREKEVLDLFISGQRPSEIGRVLGLQKNTISTHLSNIRTRYGVDSNFELMMAMLHRS